MTNETENLTARILAACQVPPRVTRAHIRAIETLREVLTDNFDRKGSTIEPTLAEMAESLAAKGLDYGTDGGIAEIRVQRRGGYDCVEFTSNGTWLNVGALLGIVEDFGCVPPWWQDDWTEVRRDGVWIAREEIRRLASEPNE